MGSGGKASFLVAYGHAEPNGPAAAPNTGCDPMLPKGAAVDWPAEPNGEGPP